MMKYFGLNMEIFSSLRKYFGLNKEIFSSIRQYFGLNMEIFRQLTWPGECWRRPGSAGPPHHSGEPTRPGGASASEQTEEEISGNIFIIIKIFSSYQNIFSITGEHSRYEIDIKTL